MNLGIRKHGHVHDHPLVHFAPQTSDNSAEDLPESRKVYVRMNDSQFRSSSTVLSFFPHTAGNRLTGFFPSFFSFINRLYFLQQF